MRTIELVEYAAARAALDPHELEQILAAGLVDVAPLPRGEGYELRAGSIVGTVVLRDVRLLIRPKVGLANLFFLLGFGEGLTRWVAERFPYGQDADLLEVVAWLFAASTARALERGVVRGYVALEATDAVLRGRLDILRQVRVHQDRPYPLICRYDEYTEDVHINRVVRAALDRVLALPQLAAGTARLVRAGRRAFGGVSAVEYTPAALPEVTFTRLDRHWEEPYRLARLVLQRQTLRDRSGAILGAAFTVDMNRLFQRLVERIIGDEARRSGCDLEAEPRRYLAAQVPIRPDLVVRRDGRDLAVADAKYKVPEGGGGATSAGADHADLYQMLAYCVSLGLPAGLLVYAAPQPLVAHSVERAQVRLEAVGIDLQTTPAAIERQLRAAARHLIDQATAGCRRGGR